MKTVSHTQLVKNNLGRGNSKVMTLKFECAWQGSQHGKRAGRKLVWRNMGARSLTDSGFYHKGAGKLWREGSEQE